MNTELLFPIYRTITGSGSTADYEVIGWVGFVVEDVTGGGSNANLAWLLRASSGRPPATTAPAVDYGVRSIELIE